MLKVIIYVYSLYDLIKFLSAFKICWTIDFETLSSMTLQIDIFFYYAIDLLFSPSKYGTKLKLISFFNYILIYNLYIQEIFPIL
jgi:hypothetical protein